MGQRGVLEMGQSGGRIEILILINFKTPKKNSQQNFSVLILAMLLVKLLVS